MLTNYNEPARLPIVDCSRKRKTTIDTSWLLTFGIWRRLWFQVIT